MNDKVEATKIKQMRRLLLNNMNRLYPTALQIQTLYNSMCGFDENYDFSLLEKDIAYLKDKGYIEYVDDMLGGADSFRKKCVKLTASGKEIADRTQTDPALEI